jgi:hypothetical protein
MCVLLASVAMTACSAHETQTVKRSLSPLIGTWTRDGATPRGATNGGPQFTSLTFTANGALHASYVAGGVGALLGSAPSVKSEDDTYRTSDTTLSIAEGTSHLEYGFRVSGSKLYLTRPGAGDAAVFSKGS